MREREHKERYEKAQCQTYPVRFRKGGREREGTREIKREVRLRAVQSPGEMSHRPWALRASGLPVLFW